MFFAASRTKLSSVPTVNEIEKTKKSCYSSLREIKLVIEKKEESPQRKVNSVGN